MRPKVVGLMAGLTALAGTATAVGLHLAADNATSSVLGEKIIGSGTSSASPVLPNGSNQSHGNPANNGNGNSGNAGKVFSISGSVDGLFPGGTVYLQLHVGNALNQSMQVQSLTAKLGAIDTATTASGTCDAPVTIGKWSGPAFTLPAHTTDMTAPGNIPVTLSHTAADSCQGATIHFNFSGSAVQS